jgi:hypothetical protein
MRAGGLVLIRRPKCHSAKPIRLLPKQVNRFQQDRTTLGVRPTRLLTGWMPLQRPYGTPPKIRRLALRRMTSKRCRCLTGQIARRKSKGSDLNKWPSFREAVFPSMRGPILKKARLGAGHSILLHRDSVRGGRHDGDRDVSLRPWRRLVVGHHTPDRNGEGSRRCRREVSRHRDGCRQRPLPLGRKACGNHCADRALCLHRVIGPLTNGMRHLRRHHAWGRHADFHDPVHYSSAKAPARDLFSPIRPLSAMVARSPLTVKELGRDIGQAGRAFSSLA